MQPTNQQQLNQLQLLATNALHQIPPNEKEAFQAYVQIIVILQSQPNTPHQQDNTNNKIQLTTDDYIVNDPTAQDLLSLTYQDLAELLLESQFLDPNDCQPELDKLHINPLPRMPPTTTAVDLTTTATAADSTTTTTAGDSTTTAVDPTTTAVDPTTTAGDSTTTAVDPTTTTVDPTTTTVDMRTAPMTLEEYGLAILDKLIMEYPDRGAKKYFLKGQALQSVESLPLFIKAKEIAENELENQPSLNIQLINILLAVSDLYLSVLCDEPEAQETIVKCLERAAELDPQNFSVLAQRAIYNKIIGQEESALEDSKAAIESFQKYIDNPNLDDIPDTDATMIFASLCSDLKLHDQAIRLIDFLLLRDDTRDDVWYRLAHVKFAAGDLEGALEALDCCDQLFAVYNENELTQNGLQAVRELRQEVQEAAKR